LRFLAFLLLLLSSSIFSQNDPFHKLYGVSDGLPSSELYDLEQGPDGKIWIGTDRGLCSYDGYNFKTFDGSDGLPSSTVFEIFSNGTTIYIASFDGALSKVENNQVIEIKEIKDNPINSHWISHLAFDNKSNSVKYFNKFLIRNEKMGFKQKNPPLLGSYNFGKNRVSIDTFKFDNFQTLDTKVGDKFLYEPNFNTITTYEYTLDSTRIYFINQYFIRHYSNYSFRNINFVPNKIFTLKDNIQKEIYSSADAFRKIYKDHNGSIWICTSKGILLYNEQENANEFSSFFTNYNTTSIIQDNENNYWISTLNNGLIYVPNFDIKTINIRSESYAESLEKNELNLFLSLHNSEIFILDKAMKPQLLLNTNSANSSAIAVSEDHVYIGYSHHLKYSSDGSYNIIANSHNYSPRKQLVLENGDIISGMNHLTYLNSSGEWIDSSGIVSAVLDLSQLENGDILGATLNGLISIKNYDLSQIHQLEHTDPAFSKRINSIDSDKNNLAFIGTAEQGVKVILADSLVGNLEKELSSNIINTLHIEKDSILWVGTNNGLDRISYTWQDSFYVNSISTVNTTRGLVSNYITDLTDWNNQLWVLTDKGLNYFDPKTLKPNITAPKITIDSILVEQHKIIPDSATDFDYSKENFEFYYTGISFKKSNSGNFYKYRLISDRDSTWFYSNNKNVRYTNLAYGDYTFQVAAQNNNKVWSTSESYSFRINPHFTETPLFKLTMLFLSLALAFFINRIRDSRIMARELQKQQLKEAELKTKAAELNALRNQMNPHFIYNSLNSIQNFIFKNDPERANYLLSRFSKLMRSSLQLSKLEYISLKEEIEFLNNYLELEKMRFEDKFEFNIAMGTELVENYKIPPLLIQPIVENSIKHGFSGLDKKGKLIIKFIKDDDHLIISVIDNGKGFSPQNLNNSNNKFENRVSATTIIKERIELLNFEDKSNSWFKIEPHYIDKLLAGTKVELRIPYLV